MVASVVRQAIHQRRSLRRYQPQPVAVALIEEILEAGCWAPSAHNRQPWRFAVLTDAEAKDDLARAMGARLRADLERDHMPSAVVDREVLRSYDRLTKAPVLIVICLSMRDMDQYPDEKRNRAEYIMAVQSVAMAGQNILLAASEAGLGACWMCAPLFCPDVVQTSLDLPADWQAQGLISMGYAAQERERQREPLASRAVWR